MVVCCREISHIFVPIYFMEWTLGLNNNNFITLLKSENVIHFKIILHIIIFARKYVQIKKIILYAFIL